MRRIIIILILFLTSCSENPQEPDVLLGIITGRITDFETNEPLPGARVTTSPTTSSKITDASGSYTIPDVEPGTYVVTSEKDGFTTRSASVNVEADRTVSADLQLPAIKPTLGVSTTLINFSTSLTILTFNISNVTQHGILQWTITENTDWVTVSPTNGATSDEMDQVAVNVDRTGQIYGNHNTQLQISSNGGEIYIDILMVVQNPNAPQLTVDTQDIDFGDSESSRLFNITNTGTGDLIWSISEGYDWLDVTPSSGSTANETEPVIVTANRNNLDQDVYTANLGVTSNGGNASINVRMEVSEAVIPPVTLSEPSDITETSIKLVWTRITHPNFAFYRLYRSDMSGVSESSTMIFETSNIADNTYTETGLSPSTTYYYKVFVIDLEKVGTGSNEVHSTTATRIGSWSLVRSFDRRSFRDIALIDANSGFIVGYSNGTHPMVKYFNGANFSDEELYEGYQNDLVVLESISIASPEDVWAVGGSIGMLINFNGNEWNRVHEGLYPQCVHALPNGIVWVGLKDHILRYNGSSFQYYDVNNGEYILDLLLFSEEDIYCVSDIGIIRHYDGFGWAVFGEVDGSLSAIDGTSSEDLWITGSEGIYHYNGVEWEHVDAVTNFSGLDIEVINESLVWFTGSSGKIFLFNGDEWRTVDNPLMDNINGVCFYDSIGWAIDSRGNVARYSE
jgi:hypothetical protein